MAPVPTAIRNFAASNIKGLADTGVNVLRTPLDAGTSLMNQLELNNPAVKNNPTALAAAQKHQADTNGHLHQDLESALSIPRFIPRAFVQAAASIPGTTPHTSDNVYHPDNPLARGILGGEDVPSLENIYKTAPGGVANKAVTTGGTALMDALAIAGGVKSAEHGVDVAGDVGKKVVASPLVQSERGSIAGPKSIGFDEAQKKGLTFTGADGVPYYEYSDKGAAIKPAGVAQLQAGKTVNLADVLTHPEMETRYPTWFGDKGDGIAKVVLDQNAPAKGTFDKSTRTISINPQAIANLDSKIGRETLIHEIAHHTQNFEGGATGTTPQAVIDATRSPELIKAQNYLNTNQERYNTLQNNMKQGLISRDTFKNDPFVKEFQGNRMQARAIMSASPVENGMAAYNANPAEQLAQRQASQMNLSNRELAKIVPDSATKINLQNKGDVVSAAAEPPKGKIVQNSLTAKADQQPLADEVKAGISGQHTQRNTAQLAADAATNATKLGTDATIQAAHDAMAVPDGHISSPDIALANEAIQRAQLAGRNEDAVAIHDALSNHLMAKGQDIQAGSLLYKLNPQALAFKAARDIKKAGGEITPELTTKMQSAVDNMNQAKAANDAAVTASQGAKVGSPEAKLVRSTGDALAQAKHDFGRIVGSAIPSSNLDKGLGLWKSELISSPLTAAKVGVSYGFTAPAEVASKGIAALADRGMSLVTGKRSLTLTPEGIGTGLAHAAQAIPTKLKTGVDLPGTGGFDTGEYKAGIQGHHTTYEHPWVQTMTELPGRVHAALSKPLAAVTYDTSIADQAHAAASNLGLTGAEKEAFINQARINPTDDMKNVANKDAAYSINQQTTAAGKWASKMQQSDNPVGRLIGNVLVPFTRIPSAIGTKGILDYTPLGLGKEVVSQLASKNFDQRSMAQAIGRSTTGTAVAGLGAYLMSQGRMTAAAPIDAHQKALWDAQGLKPNSIIVGGYSENGQIVGGKSMSLNALGALGITLALGGGFQKGLQDSNGNVAQAAIVASAVAGKTLASQPYLKGISGAANALNDPARYASIFMDQTAGSVIPAIVANAARAGDSTARVTNSIPDTLKSRIPGLRNGLQPQQDMFGNNIAEPSGVQALIDPFATTSQIPATPATAEIQRLYNTTGANGKPITTVDEVAKKLNITQGQQKVPVAPADRTQYIAQTGPQISQAIAQMIKDPAYQALTDAQKKSQIDSVVSGIRDAYLVKNLGSTVKLSADGKTALAGGLPSVNSTLGISDKIPSNLQQTLRNYQAATDKQAYKDKNELALARAQYANNMATGKLEAGSPTAFAAQSALNKLAITSQFSDNVVAYNSLSKSQKAAYAAQNPTEAAQLQSQSNALNKALYGAGISSGRSTGIRKAKAPSFKTANASYTKLLRGTSIKTPKAPRMPKIATIKTPKPPKVVAFKPPKIGKLPKIA